MAGYTCLLLYHLLDGVAGYGWGVLKVLCVQLLCLGGLSSSLCYRNLAERRCRMHHYLHGHSSFRTPEYTFPDAIANHREAYLYRIGCLQAYAELAFQITHGDLALCRAGYCYQLERTTILVDDFAFQGKIVCDSG